MLQKTNIKKDSFNMIKKLPFNKFYKLFNSISLLLIVLSIFLLVFNGLNFGVDFKGGTLIELRSMDKNVTVTNIRDSLNQINLGDVSVKKFGKDDDYLVKFEKKDLNNPNFIKEIKIKELILKIFKERINQMNI